MRNYLLFVQLQLRGLFGAGRLSQKKGKRGGLRLAGFALAALGGGAFFIGAAVLYNWFFLTDLHEIGKPELLYPAAFNLLFLILLLTYLFLTAGSLHGGKDYELVASLPVSHGTVVLAKLTGYYVLGVLISAAYMIPTMCLCGADQSSAWFYPVAVLILFLLPLLAFAPALFLGTLAAAIASHCKKKTAVQTLIILICYFAAAAAALIGADPEAGGMGLFFAQMPIGALFGRSATQPNGWIFLLLAAVSIGAFAGAFFFAAALYPRINTQMRSYAAAKRRAERSGKTHTPATALLRREFRMVFSNLTLLMNVVSAGVMCVLLSVAFLFLRDLLIADAVYRSYFVLFLPVGLGGFCSLTVYGAAAINVEGAELWLLKSLPVSSETVLRTKLTASVLLCLPEALVSVVVCAFALALSFSELILFAAVLLCIVLCENYAALLVNLCRPSLAWKNRTQAAKQSSSVIISMLVNLVISFLMAGVCYAFSVAGASVGLFAAALLAAALSAAGYLLLYGWGVRRFETL